MLVSPEVRCFRSPGKRDAREHSAGVSIYMERAVCGAAS